MKGMGNTYTTDEFHYVAAGVLRLKYVTSSDKMISFLSFSQEVCSQFLLQVVNQLTLAT